MANWGNAQEGLVKGFQVGQATGGRLSGLGSVIAKVADRLRSQRETGEQLNILGQTEQIKRMYNPPEWKPKTQEEALEFERAKTGIQAESPKVIATQKRQNLVDSTKVREEFINRPEVKEYMTINTQVKSMDSLLNKATSGDIKNKVALDQALITMYNKLTDPNSVVRESEYARTPQNLPLANRFTGALQKLEKGGAGMTDSDRKALVWGAKVIANERGNTFNQTLQEYSDLSDQYGIEKNLITRGIPTHKDYEIALDKELGGKAGIVTIQDITGKTIQIPRQEAIKRGYING